MTIEIGLLFTAASVIIGVSTFLIGRQSAAKKDGQTWGEFTTELKKDIEYIKRDVSDIKSTVGESNQELRASIRRLHKRIDDHEKEYHNKITTRREGEDV